jgi:hypothetical protein
MPARADDVWGICIPGTKAADSRTAEPTNPEKIPMKIKNVSVKSGIKAGGLGTMNHSRGLAVRSAVKAGGLSTTNHSRGLR